MENQKRVNLLSDLGKLGSVELINIEDTSVMEVRFTNTSIRMCACQFEAFTMMLNEAMITLVKDDNYYKDMKELILQVKDSKTKDEESKKNNIH